MWFRRQTRNRRLGREHVLDVKLRSSQVRSARARMAAVALGMVFGTIACLYLLWRAGESALNCFVYQNKSFAIQIIDMQTDGVIPVEKLRSWARVRNGDNLLALDLARVKRDLEMVPLVKTVSVERILPRTLRVRVAEREPVALIAMPKVLPKGGLETSAVQIDGEGFVVGLQDLKVLETATNSPVAPLPIIFGVKATELQTGRRLEDSQVQRALQLVAAFEHSPMAGLVELRRINVSSLDTLLVTTEQGSEITFGADDPARQLRRWREIFDQAQLLGHGIASVDLAVANSIPVRWLEANAAPPVSAKPPKPTRTTRKKNV
jgi:cell division septal protein FtsQ